MGGYQTMRTLCFQGNYRIRFARYKEFCHQKVETVLDDFLKEFCDLWLREEFEVLTGAARYERTAERSDFSGGHYTRRLLTTRGALKLKVPRGKRRYYTYSLFQKYDRRSPEFDRLVIESVLLGHSTRKAKRFFGDLLRDDDISHALASKLFRKFDTGLNAWRTRPLKDQAVVVVLDAVHLRGVIPYLREAKPVLFAYAIYEDGHEEILGFEPAQGESFKAWTGFCQRLYDLGLKKVKLVVSDDNAAIAQAASFAWPKSLHQACIFHLMQNLTKGLRGHKDKHKIIEAASWLFEAQSEAEFTAWAIKFKATFKTYLYHPAIRQFMKKWPESIQFYKLPKAFWAAAKTSNRLERLFEELKRRVKAFRRFPNTKSCERWLYALITEVNKPSNIRLLTLTQSQHDS